MITIKVGFSKNRHDKIGSLLIQNVEKRNYSHTYIKYNCLITGIPMIAQAANGMIHEISEERFLINNIEVEFIEIEITLEQFNKLFSYIQLKKGTPYSYIQLLYIGFKKIFKFELKDTDKDAKMVCSEFIIRCLRILNKDFAKGIENLDYVSPSDLNKLLKEG